jgi:hypothetical protein
MRAKRHLTRRSLFFGMFGSIARQETTAGATLNRGTKDRLFGAAGKPPSATD